MANPPILGVTIDTVYRGKKTARATEAVLQ